jgi:dipeptidyl aminopeptidase/acylaminoacyl peptidase
MLCFVRPITSFHTAPLADNRDSAAVAHAMMKAASMHMHSSNRKTIYQAATTLFLQSWLVFGSISWQAHAERQNMMPQAVLNVTQAQPMAAQMPVSAAQPNTDATPVNVNTGTATTPPPADTTTFSADKLLHVQRISGLTASPDGLRLAFSLTRYDTSTEKNNADIQLLDLRTGQISALTVHPDNDSQPAWSPDGRQLVFVAKRGQANAQLWLLPVTGGEARALTQLPVNVSQPTWFADGQRVLFVAEVPANFSGDLTELGKTADKTTVYRTEQHLYRFWDKWLTSQHYPQLFSIEVNSGKITQLTKGWQRWFNLEGNHQFSISPDGRRIAIAANSTEPPYSRLNSDIYLLNTDGSGEAINITAENPADDVNPVFSPDGRFLVYGARKSLTFSNDNIRLQRYDLATGKRSELASNVDLSASDWLISDDSRMLYFTAPDQARDSVFSVPTQGGSVKQVLRQGSNEQLVALGNDRFALVQHGLSQLPELFLLDNRNRTLKQISKVNQQLQQESRFGRVEEAAFAGADGKMVQMFIVYPPDFATDKRWPLLNVLHGGPHSFFGDQFNLRWNAQVFASAGYVTILPNFHGSTSFGQAFAESIHGDHASKPFFDSEAAVDYMVSRGFIDESRVAAAGASYGGYLVHWIAGHSTKYRALINHAGVYNLMAQFASDVTSHRVYAYGGAPWVASGKAQGIDQIQKINPAMAASQFKTPTLITHGEQDFRVPLTQGLEAYGVLKGKGVDARLVVFPQENHWILQPKNSQIWYQETLAWLEKYIGKGPTAP